MPQERTGSSLRASAVQPGCSRSVPQGLVRTQTRSAAAFGGDSSDGLSYLGIASDLRIATETLDQRTRALGLLTQPGMKSLHAPTYVGQ